MRGGGGVGHTASDRVTGAWSVHSLQSRGQQHATFLDYTDYAVLAHAASVIFVNMEVYTLALLVEGLFDASACSALAV